jgi:hypothetical protein
LETGGKFVWRAKKLGKNVNVQNWIHLFICFAGNRVQLGLTASAKIGLFRHMCVSTFFSAKRVTSIMSQRNSSLTHRTVVREL